MNSKSILKNKRNIVLASLAFILTITPIVLGEQGESGIAGSVLLGPQYPVMRPDMEELCQAHLKG